MNHWLILLLTIVAMWAIVLVFMWWWTTENWDWASAELKPPRTVPQEPQLHTHPKPLKAYLDWVDWRGELEQRVKNLDYHLLAVEECWEQRVAALEEGQEDLERGAHSLILTHIKAWHSPSPPMASPTTGSPSDAAEQESIPPESPASWRSGQTTMTGGPVAPDSEYADPSDAST